MKILIIIFLGAICFSCCLISRDTPRKAMLYTLSIGGAVNANFFHAQDYPLQVGWATFGIDSVIYTLAIFCVFVMYYFYGKKDAKALTASMLSAIFFSATMQLVAELSTSSISNTTSWIKFYHFNVSILSTLFAIYLMVLVTEKMKKKGVDKYIILIINLSVASFVNSILYYTLSFAITKNIGENFSQILVGSLGGKLISLVFATISFSILLKMENKKTKPQTNNC